MTDSASLAQTSRLKRRQPRADDWTVRATIFGTVGVIWGGAIIASSLLDRAQQPDTAHVAGELMAMAFGALLVAVGARALVRRYR